MLPFSLSRGGNAPRGHKTTLRRYPMPPASTNLLDLVIQGLLRVGLAILLWLVGRLVISIVLKLTRRALETRKIDSTATRYIVSALSLLLNIILIFALLGVFGIQTTGFAAILAGAGVAIGVAISGLLAHFAAGLFMLVLRPFKVGDFIVAGGVTGTVTESACCTPRSIRRITYRRWWATTPSSTEPSRTSARTPIAACCSGPTRQQRRSPAGHRPAGRFG